LSSDTLRIREEEDTTRQHCCFYAFILLLLFVTSLLCWAKRDRKNDYSQAFEQGVLYVDNIETLNMNLDRLEVFKPTSSNLVLSAEQILTNDVTRAKASVAKRDIRVLSAFKEVKDESTKILPRLLSILINILPRPSIRISTFLLLLLFITFTLFWHELKQVERDHQEEPGSFVEADAQVRYSPLIRSIFCQ